MTKPLAADNQQSVDFLSSDEEILTRDSDRQAFKEAAATYRHVQNQISVCHNMLKMLSGTAENPSVLWRTIESYGEATNPNDRQESVLRMDGQIWSIRRTGNKATWNTERAVELFKAAYLTTRAPDGSEKQIESFSNFRNMLEAASNGPLELDDEAWWQLIDQAAELYCSAVERTIRADVLDGLRNTMPQVLVSALKTRSEPSYGLHLQSRKDQHKMAPLMAASCSECSSTVDAEDFYCKFCGAALGTE